MSAGLVRNNVPPVTPKWNLLQTCNFYFILISFFSLCERGVVFFGVWFFPPFSLASSSSFFFFFFFLCSFIISPFSSVCMYRRLEAGTRTTKRRRRRKANWEMRAGFAWRRNLSSKKCKRGQMEEPEQL